MKMGKSSRKFRVFMILITAALIAFAFWQSSMPASISNDESEKTLDFIEVFIKALGLTPNLTDFVIRKSAHFCEYTAIGMFLMNTAYSFNRLRPHKYYFQVLFVGLLTAVIDEAIQLNVAGRSGQITDVLLDFSGIIFGSAVMWIIQFIYKKIRKIHS